MLRHHGPPGGRAGHARTSASIAATRAAERPPRFLVLWRIVTSAPAAGTRSGAPGASGRSSGRGVRSVVHPGPYADAVHAPSGELCQGPSAGQVLEPPGPEFTANLLAAFVGRMSELMAEAAAETVGARGEAAAALVSIRSDPGISIRRLADVLGIAQPTAVVMVERLRAQGLVDKRQGPDARTAALFLTAAGARSAGALLSARRRIAQEVLVGLDAVATGAVHAALAAMLASLTTDRATGDHICRSCDEPSCPQDLCPVERALR